MFMNEQQHQKHILIHLHISYSFNFSAPTAKINGQTTPLDVTGLSQNEIQALLLGSHPSAQSISVKREPEDLRKDPKCSRNQKVMNKSTKYTLFYIQTNSIQRSYNVWFVYTCIVYGEYSLAHASTYQYTNTTITLRITFRFQYARFVLCISDTIAKRDFFFKRN